MSVVEEGADARASSSLEDAEERLSRDGQRGRRRPIGLHQVVQGDDVLGALPDLVARIAATGPVLVLADAVPMGRDGADLKPHIVSLLAGHQARLVTLGEPGEELHADMAAVDAARAALAGAGCVVAVGSGTHLRHRQEGDRGRASRSRYVVVQTAVLRERVLRRHGRAAAPRREAHHAVALARRAGHRPGGHRGRAGGAQPGGRGRADLDVHGARRLATCRSRWASTARYDEAVVGLFRDGGEELERVAAGRRARATSTPSRGCATG